MAILLNEERAMVHGWAACLQGLNKILCSCKQADDQTYLQQKSLNGSGGLRKVQHAKAVKPWRALHFRCEAIRQEPGSNRKN